MDFNVFDQLDRLYDTEAEPIIEALEVTPELQKKIKSLIGLYANKLTLSSASDNPNVPSGQILICTYVRPAAAKSAHKEMLDILKKGGFKVVDDFDAGLNPLNNEYMSFINISNAGQLTEALEKTPELEKEIKELIGLYAQELKISSASDNPNVRPGEVAIFTSIRPEAAKVGHKEMIDILKEAGYKIVDDFDAGFNSLSKEYMSFIFITK